jgi:hypothetical protein
VSNYNAVINVIAVIMAAAISPKSGWLQNPYWGGRPPKYRAHAILIKTSRTTSIHPHRPTQRLYLESDDGNELSGVGNGILNLKNSYPNLFLGVSG